MAQKIAATEFTDKKTCKVMFIRQLRPRMPKKKYYLCAFGLRKEISFAESRSYPSEFIICE